MLRASSGIWSSIFVEPHPVLGDQWHEGRARSLGDGQMQSRVQPPVVLRRGSANVGHPAPQRLAFGGGRGPARGRIRAGADLEDLAEAQRVVDLGAVEPDPVSRLARESPWPGTCRRTGGRDRAR
jgi:hypothetical protein